MLRTTSIAAIEALALSGELKTQEDKVLALLKMHPEGLTLNEVGRALGLYPSTAAARLNGLKAKTPPAVGTRGAYYMDERLGKRWVDFKRRDKETGLYGLLWYATKEPEQGELF
jgi:hypothetical protein